MIISCPSREAVVSGRDYLTCRVDDHRPDLGRRILALGPNLLGYAEEVGIPIHARAASATDGIGTIEVINYKLQTFRRGICGRDPRRHAPRRAAAAPWTPIRPRPVLGAALDAGR